MITLPYHILSLRWIVPAGFMLGSAPTFYVVWGCWRLVSSALPSRVYRAGDDCLYSLYQRLVLFFFECCTGVEVVLYGDVDEVLSRQENVIFFSNHQCTVDWMVADILAVRQGSLGHIRYILKDGLKYLPLYGFYFRQHSCVYVKRGGRFDESKAQRQLSSICQSDTPVWFRTRYSPDLPATIGNSRSYAQSKGFPVYSNVLTPRVKALQLCIDRLRPAAAAVYDVTIAYSSTLPSMSPQPAGHRLAAPSLSDFLQGRCRTLHVHVRRISMEHVPSTSDDSMFTSWLMERFAVKDRLLSEFYSTSAWTTQDGDRSSEDVGGRVTLSTCWASTLPAFILFASLNTALWSTVTGRVAWSRVALLGTIVSWVVVSIRS